MPYHGFFDRDREHGGSPGRYGNVGGSPGRYGFHGRNEEFRDPPPPEPPRKKPGLGSGVRFFHGPIRFSFFGRPIFISTGRQIGFIVGLVALLVMVISTFATFNGLKYTKQELADYQTYYAEKVADSNECLETIQKAKAGESGYYTTIGCFENYLASRDTYDYSGNSCYIYKYHNGYYIRFMFLFGEDDEFQVFDTFAMYSNRGEISNTYRDFDVEGMKNMKQFNVSYKVENGKVVCAVNSDYDGSVNFERDYYEQKIVELKSSIKTYKTSAVILIVIVVGIIALVVLSVVKVFKNSKKKAELETQKQEAEAKEAQAKADMAKQELEEKNRYCIYCGAKLPDGAVKCPNCGSTQFDVKNQ